MTDLKQRVIVALDHKKPETAIALIDELGSEILWYKIGPVLFCQNGLEIIEYLHRKNKKIFLDLKLHDIPNVVGATVTKIAELGVQLLTVHCLGGGAMLKAASEACRGSGLRILGVTLLTSHSQKESAAIGWDDQSSVAIVERLLKLALENRLGGVVCSPNEIDMVRAMVQPEFQIVTPGIRFADETVYQDDQARTASPNEAFARGASYIVVGRPITQAREPKKAAQKLLGQLA